MDRALPDGFEFPSFDAPVDVDAHYAAVPPGATVKGMQLQQLYEVCRDAGHVIHETGYRALGDYPGEEFIRALVAASNVLYPNVPLREGLRRVGRLAYPTLRDSLLGKVIFSTVARDIRGVWRWIARGYEVSNSSGTATLLEVGESHAIMRLEGIYSFLDAWHVGAAEGLLTACHVRGGVGIRRISFTSGDAYVYWDAT